MIGANQMPAITTNQVLRPLAGSSSQSVFDTVVKHLRKQGKKSIVPNCDGVGHCRYRGDDGAMCAVGCLITNRQYNLNMEGACVDDLIHSYPKDFGWMLKHQNLLIRLQGTHDGVEVECWESEFADIAKDFSLVLPPV